jgi:hypothetical protein
MAGQTGVGVSDDVAAISLKAPARVKFPASRPANSRVWKFCCGAFGRRWPLATRRLSLAERRFRRKAEMALSSLPRKPPETAPETEKWPGFLETMSAFSEHGACLKTNKAF